jgi:flagellar biosynthesis GTPase FlhF
VSISLGGGSPIGWFPLGPREVYVPSYQASRDYFTRVNVNNTVINNTTIINVYNNYSRGTINVDQVNYANRRVEGAVTAVPSTVFVNAQPVRPAAIRVDRKVGTTGEITRVAPIAPSARSVTGAGKTAEARPSREAIDRPVFVRNAPPPGERPFAVREQQLQKTPGRAPEPAAVKPAPGRDDSTAQKVRVIGEQRGAVDARAAGSRRTGDRPGTPAAVPGKLKPLDRSVEPEKEPGPGPGGRGLDQAPISEGEAQQQQQAAERKRQLEMQQQQDAEKQQAERKRQLEIQQQQAAEKQQAERKRQTEIQQQQADERQQAERKRQSEIQQQQAAEKQQAERKRQVETPQQQAERKRQLELQQKRQAECEREAIRLNQDVSKCKIEALPQENRDNPNRDRNVK